MAKILLAHLKEMLDSYERLGVAELEGHLLEAIFAFKIDWIGNEYVKLAAARAALAQAELGRLGG